MSWEQQSGGRRFAAGPLPLTLYVHIPWCLRKCPYCDFNSHPLRERLPDVAYVDALLRDLEREASRGLRNRQIVSVFIGGGTPSLLPGRAIARLLRGIRGLIDLASGAEISLEANPGAVDCEHFAAYGEAGVNRLSIGAQSLSTRHLKLLGRIHDAREVRLAVANAREAGCANLNLDLMYGLPEQSLDAARRDLEQALTLEPDHLSYYQLTVEPNTVFYRAPPVLADEDLAADMQLQGEALLGASGYAQYEVSAYARPKRQCEHNLNYWRFGDYLGIGAGAHGKLTGTPSGRVERWSKHSDPAAYLRLAGRGQPASGHRVLDDADLVLEFAMNALRLREGFEPDLFEQRTGLPFPRIASIVDGACADGLLCRYEGRVLTTERGRWVLNELLQRFGSWGEGKIPGSNGS